MTAGDRLCPTCRAPLERASSRWELRACLACGGVWTDAACSRRIVSVVDRELVDIAKDFAMRAAEGNHDPTEAGAGEGARMCPECQEPLTCVRSGRVFVDVCRGHGTWFDRDELGRLARNLEYERLSVVPGSGGAEPAASSRNAEMLLAILGRADET